MLNKYFNRLIIGCSERAARANPPFLKGVGGFKYLEITKNAENNQQNNEPDVSVLIERKNPPNPL